MDKPTSFRRGANLPGDALPHRDEGPRLAPCAALPCSRDRIELDKMEENRIEFISCLLPPLLFDDSLVHQSPTPHIHYYRIPFFCPSHLLSPPPTCSALLLSVDDSAIQRDTYRGTQGARTQAWGEDPTPSVPYGDRDLPPSRDRANRGSTAASGTD